MTVSGLSGGLFSSPKHFLEIRRADETGNFGLVKRTEAYSGKTITAVVALSGTQLNNGDNQRTIQIELYSYKSNGAHKKVGSFQTNGEELKISGKQWTIGKSRLHLIKIHGCFKYYLFEKLVKIFILTPEPCTAQW